jgi:AcrR family transcriptional regulator
VTIATQRTKRRQSREETRRQILVAAQEFLRERSYRELSVDELMSRTSHSRTVFYRHFDDIPSLVLAMIQEVGTELMDIARAWAEADRVSSGEAREQLGLFVDFYARNGPLVHAVAEAAHHDDVVEETYSALVEGYVALTTKAIEARVERGELAPIDAPEVARALVRMLNGYLDDALGGDREADPKRVLDTVTTIWTRTLFPGES